MAGLQFGYDWSREFSSPQEMETELRYFNFNGPGLYLTSAVTLLVVPNPPEGRDDESDDESVWSWKQPNGTRYTVYVWNCPYEQTLFRALHHVPIRMARHPNPPIPPEEHK